MASLFSQQPLAPRYDGKSRDLVVESSGVLASCHYVDALMTIGLCTRKGSWKSSPNIGQTLHEIQYVGKALQQDAERRIRAAEPIATLLAAGDAEIRTVYAERLETGGIVASVDYVNKRLDANRVQRISNQE